MVVTFPHLGNVCFAVKALFETLQIPFVIPDPNSKETLRRGAFYSPEEICLPFKIMMGNYIQAIEKGADTLLITGSNGPCRFGEYCELAMKILERMGYRNLHFVVVDSPFAIGREEFLRRIGSISESSPVSTAEKFRGLKVAFQIESLLDRLDALAHDLAGYEVNRGDCRRLLGECKKKAMSCRSPEETIGLLNEYKKRFGEIEADRGKSPVKIAIIGEIYTIIEPFSNFYIEDRLMDCGVSTRRTLTPSWWAKDMMLKPLKLNSVEIRKAAGEYLPCNIGGHGRECIGEALLAHEENLDGAIQIFPLGCMPEVVAKSILPSIQKDKDFPVMTLIVDEMTGEAGFMTRVEAFLDMLEFRKKARV